MYVIGRSYSQRLHVCLTTRYRETQFGTESSAHDPSRRNHSVPWPVRPESRRSDRFTILPALFAVDVSWKGRAIKLKWEGTAACPGGRDFRNLSTATLRHIASRARSGRLAEHAMLRASRQANLMYLLIGSSRMR